MVRILAKMHCHGAFYDSYSATLRILKLLFFIEKYWVVQRALQTCAKRGYKFLHSFLREGAKNLLLLQETTGKNLFFKFT